ncbi:MAG: 4-(cytidine 5'-diphospho)-2-C-methyl-D-erythritol kinase [Candidatus Korobacteraceae bacterium]
MSIAIRSFAKINLGLKIGPARPDGFHELRTIYQTLALHDVVRVEVQPGSGIEIRCNDPRVPLDATNTCYKMAERVLAILAGAGTAASRETTGPSAPLRSARDDKNNRGARNGAPGGAPLQNQTEAAPPQNRTEAAPLQSQTEAAKANARVERRFSAASQPDISFPEPALAGGRIVIDIDKRLPVQGGMGAASSNAVAAMLGLERALGVELAAEDKLRIAAEVGSDVPLFLIGGTVLGVGRGEEVYPLPDLPTQHVVVVTPPIGVSTPKAFAQWDELAARNAALTAPDAAGTINKFSESVFAWLNASYDPQAGPPASLGLGGVEVKPASGVPAIGGDRAETPLLDLVRAGIENDFERVVFPEYPELREVKRVLQREGALYASLSGSGSTLYGLFASAREAQAAAERMIAAGYGAVATTTLTREEYWKAVTRG